MRTTPFNIQDSPDVPKNEKTNVDLHILKIDVT